MEELHGGRLLVDLDALLESDLEIDELGFLLPSQMMELHSLPNSSDIAIFFSFDEDEVSSDHSMEAAADKNTEFCFWLRDHKLAISVTALRPLYRAAQAALLVAQKEERRDSRKQNNGVFQVVDRILKATRALVIVNSDNNSAWNARKRIIVSESSTSPSLLVQELRLTGLVLSYAPKSEETWSHRRWIVSRMLTSQAYGGIIGSESKFVETLVQRSVMNYRAWRHRCWLVSNMTPSQVEQELRRTKSLYTLDNCFFHYRRCMLQHSISRFNGIRFATLWKEEMEWNTELLEGGFVHEALWIHRRFLADCLVSYKELLDNLLEENDDKLAWFVSKEFDFAKAFDREENVREHSCSYRVWLFYSKLQRDGGVDKQLEKECNSAVAALSHRSFVERHISFWH